MRWAIFLICFCLGCRTWTTSPQMMEPEPTTAPVHRVEPPASPEIIPVVAEVPDPLEVETDGLMLAAECLDVGDPEGAATHLTEHISTCPDQIMIRSYLAELLVKLDRDADARRHFEQFVADAQQEDGPARDHLIHCHTRLMEIGIRQGDVYAERLNRGIGLYLLGKIHPEPLIREQLLCRALNQLDQARQLEPEAARPDWYLYLVQTELGEMGPARDSLQAAKAMAALSALTPAEQTRLHLVAFTTGESRR